MNGRSRMYQLAHQLPARLRELDWVAILLVRLSVGLLFFESGRGKLFFRLEELGEYFVDLGIPLPHLNALVVASLEFFGGACLVLGVGTRVIALLLGFTMLVAIITAQISEVHTLGDFLYLPEVLLAVLLTWLVFSGPGRVSVDHVLARRLGLNGRKA
ncbi:MAG: DoxX family protein [Gemmatimonadales bacterium]